MECPTCRTQHGLPPKGVDGFSTNFTATNLIELLSLHKDGSAPVAAVLKCENEIDDNPAATKCLDCNLYYCEECTVTHKTQRVTKNHKLATLTELKEGGAKQLERKRYCSDHEGEELKLYCRTCQEVICRDCAIVTHKQHDYTFIKNIREELVQEMQDLLGRVEGKVEEFTHHQNHLQEVDRKSKESVDVCRSKVQEYFKDWHRRLEEREGQLLGQLDQHLKVASKQVDAERSTVDLSKGQITSAVEFTQQLLSNGGQYDIAMMSKQTCKQLKYVQTLHWNTNSVSPCSVGFISHKDTPTAAEIFVKVPKFISNQIIVEGLGHPVPGENTFTIRLLKETAVNVLPVVSVNEASGQRLNNAAVKEKEHNQWIVTYSIPYSGQDVRYKIVVSVDRVEAKGSPFERVWKKKLEAGIRVHRGRNWHYGNVDGGSGNSGVVIDSNYTSQWVKVKWDSDVSGKTHAYRWGADVAYDVAIVV